MAEKTRIELVALDQLSIPERRVVLALIAAAKHTPRTRELLHRPERSPVAPRRSNVVGRTA